MNANDQCASVKNEDDLREILKTKDHVIALFHASWCPFCMRFMPIFKKTAEKEKRNFVMVQDDQETIADQYSIKAYPTVIFFKDGVVSKRLDGVPSVGLNEKQLVEFVYQCMEH